MDNYEKKYKEALEKARQLCAYPTTKSFIRDLQDLFPELKKSEDERIRKEIISSIKALRIIATSRDRDKAIAWLEKQGEQEKDILEDAILDGNEDGLIAETIRYKNEKQGEKKPTDSYCQKNCKGFQETGKCFTDGDCKAKKEAEQKPEENKGNIGEISPNSAWSEEDSFRTETLISVIKSGGSIRPELRNEFVNWLKSLRPQSQWKPSDEQMNNK